MNTSLDIHNLDSSFTQFSNNYNNFDNNNDILVSSYERKLQGNYDSSNSFLDFQENDLNNNEQPANNNNNNFSDSIYINTEQQQNQPQNFLNLNDQSLFIQQQDQNIMNNQNFFNNDENQNLKSEFNNTQNLNQSIYKQQKISQNIVDLNQNEFDQDFDFDAIYEEKTVYYNPESQQYLPEVDNQEQKNIIQSNQISSELPNLQQINNEIYNKTLNEKVLQYSRNFQNQQQQAKNENSCSRTSSYSNNNSLTAPSYNCCQEIQKTYNSMFEVEKGESHPNSETATHSQTLSHPIEEETQQEEKQKQQKKGKSQNERLKRNYIWFIYYNYSRDLEKDPQFKNSFKDQDSHKKLIEELKKSEKLTSHKSLSKICQNLISQNKVEIAEYLIHSLFFFANQGKFLKKKINESKRVTPENKTVYVEHIPKFNEELQALYDQIFCKC